MKFLLSQGEKEFRDAGKKICQSSSLQDWCSPRLGIRFDLGQEQLVIYRPDGDRFLSPVELAQRAEAEQQRAEQAEQRAEAAEQKANRLAQRLRELGIDPEQV